MWNQMEMLTFWEVGNKKDIRFWKDAWIEPGMQLISKLKNQSIKVNTQDTMAKMVSQPGEWNWNFISALIDKVTFEKIKAIPNPLLNSKEANM